MVIFEMMKAKTHMVMYKPRNRVLLMEIWEKKMDVKVKVKLVAIDGDDGV